MGHSRMGWFASMRFLAVTVAILRWVRVLNSVAWGSTGRFSDRMREAMLTQVARVHCWFLALSWRLARLKLGTIIGIYVYLFK